MSPNTALLLYALGAVVALIVLIARFKLHPFIALIVVSLVLGIAAEMPFGAVAKAFQDGVGTVLGFIAIVVGLGTMLGKMMAESGGATRIATTLIARFGETRVHWAIMFVAFIVGIPVFFQVGFVLLIPLVFTIARRTGLSLVKIGIPLVAGLSVVHGMMPPHPAAMLAVVAYNADIGRTIAYAILVGLPTAALAGPVFAAWIAPRIALPAENPMAAQFTGGTADTATMPGFGISLFTVLMPVVLMLFASTADVLLDAESPIRAALDFVGSPIVALLLALLFSFWSLGYRQHFTRDQILKFANDCLGPTATILLVIGAGGGFNRVLIESGVGKAIADVALGSHASPLLLAWTVAALIRVATGSATVAMTTSAGIVAPIAAATPGTAPELLVLATGAGSLVMSHVNDSGFWLIKEFFNMTVPQTLKTWTVAETIIGVAGLGFTLLLSLVVGCAPREQPLSGQGWIDVTAALDPARTPVYTGDAPMKFEFLKDMRKGDGFTLSVYSMGAHSGTHIDAPMHFIANGAPIDQVQLDPLIGAARVIDIPDSVQAIDAAELNRHDWKGAQRVLFRTRSTRRGWMDSSTFHRDFAYVAPDAAQLLADAGVVLVGVDYISAEQFGAPAPVTHQILLGRGIPIVEGLDLRGVQAGAYDLVVLPLKVRGHEGAPARAIVRRTGT